MQSHNDNPGLKRCLHCWSVVVEAGPERRRLCTSYRYVTTDAKDRNASGVSHTVRIPIAQSQIITASVLNETTLPLYTAIYTRVDELSSLSIHRALCTRLIFSMPSPDAKALRTRRGTRDQLMMMRHGCMADNEIWLPRWIPSTVFILAYSRPRPTSPLSCSRPIKTGPNPRNEHRDFKVASGSHPGRKAERNLPSSANLGTLIAGPEGINLKEKQKIKYQNSQT